MVILAMSVANADNRERTQNAEPKLGRPMMKQLIFDWRSTDKYTELRNF